MIIDKKTLIRIVEIFPSVVFTEMSVDPLGYSKEERFILMDINRNHIHGWELQELQSLPIQIDTIYFGKSTTVLHITPKKKND